MRKPSTILTVTLLCVALSLSGCQFLTNSGENSLTISNDSLTDHAVTVTISENGTVVYNETFDVGEYEVVETEDEDIIEEGNYLVRVELENGEVFEKRYPDTCPTMNLYIFIQEDGDHYINRSYCD